MFLSCPWSSLTGYVADHADVFDALQHEDTIRPKHRQQRYGHGHGDASWQKTMRKCSLIHPRDVDANECCLYPQCFWKDQLNREYIAWLGRPIIFAVCFDDRHFKLFYIVYRSILKWRLVTHSACQAPRGLCALHAFLVEVLPNDVILWPCFCLIRLHPAASHPAIRPSGAGWLRYFFLKALRFGKSQMMTWKLMSHDWFAFFHV